MLLAVIGLALSLLTSVYMICEIGIVFFYFLTNYTLLIHLFTFVAAIGLNKYSEVLRIMIITSWALGNMVTVMFWGYVFPLVKESELPPIWVYVLSHGGIHLFIMGIFLKSDIKVNGSDFNYSLAVIHVYLGGVVLPLKYVGVIIYPLFFDEVIPTLIVYTAAIILSYLGFSLGYYLKQQAKGKIL